MTAEEVLVKVEQALLERSRRERQAVEELLWERGQHKAANDILKRERAQWANWRQLAMAEIAGLRQALELANARLIDAGLEAVQP